METNTVEEALADIADGLSVDGYRLDIARAHGDCIELHVVAGPEACADCLVPKPIMLSMIQPLVAPLGVSRIDLAYPND